MQRSTRLVAAAAVAGFVALGSSAFTATSTIDDNAINVGSVSQSVSGATITSVTHSYTESTDTTTSIAAKAEQLLSRTAGAVKIAVNSGALENCTVAHIDIDLDGVDDGTIDYSNLTCDITDTVNVSSVRFVVNG